MMLDDLYVYICIVTMFSLLSLAFRKFWLRIALSIFILALVAELAILRPGVNYRKTIDTHIKQIEAKEASIFEVLRSFLDRVDVDNTKIVILCFGLVVQVSIRDRKKSFLNEIHNKQS